MYMALVGVPPMVTFEVTLEFLRKRLHANIKGIGFDSIVEPTGLRTFYFHSPKGMLKDVIIKAIDGQNMSGFRLSIYRCEDEEQLNRIKAYGKFWKYNLAPTGIKIESSDPTETKEERIRPKYAKNLIIKTSRVLYNELCDRYPGLEPIFLKNNSFVYDLVCEIRRRLGKVWESNKSLDCPKALSRVYRSAYPHDTDYLLLVKCHGSKPLPSEKELAREILELEDAVVLPDVPADQLLVAVNSCRILITQRLHTYMCNIQYNQRLPDTASDEERATALARKYMKESSTLVEGWVKQWMRKYFKTRERYEATIRVYGIPCLPDLDDLTLLLESKGAKGRLEVDATESLYNIVFFEVHRHMVRELLAVSGNTLDGCTLLVRLVNRKRNIRLTRCLHESVTDVESMAGCSKAGDNEAACTDAGAAASPQPDLLQTDPDNEEWEDFE